MSYFRSLRFVPLCLIITLSLCAKFTYGEFSEQLPMKFSYNGGALLTGTITVNFIWYGNFNTSQKSVLTDFIASLSDSSVKKPSVATWWKTLEEYYKNTGIAFPTLTLGKQIGDSSYSRGNSLNIANILPLASMGPQQNAINAVVTSADVGVGGFCISRCGLHNSGPGSSTNRFTYIWLGNSSTQCPGQCAWPFSNFNDGPYSAALVPPNGDAGTDGMVVNLASLLAGCCTNPFGNGYYQGEMETPLEAATACPGIYGKRAFPGYAGDLIVDPATNASYNVYGVNKRRYLVPALFDLSKSTCATAA